MEPKKPSRFKVFLGVVSFVVFLPWLVISWLCLWLVERLPQQYFGELKEEADLLERKLTRAITYGVALIVLLAVVILSAWQGQVDMHNKTLQYTNAAQATQIASQNHNMATANAQATVSAQQTATAQATAIVQTHQASLVCGPGSEVHAKPQATTSGMFLLIAAQGLSCAVISINGVQKPYGDDILLYVIPLDNGSVQVLQQKSGTSITLGTYKQINKTICTTPWMKSKLNGHTNLVANQLPTFAC